MTDFQRSHSDERTDEVSDLRLRLEKECMSIPDGCT